MPDFDRADQVLAIAQVISRVPTGQKSRPYMGTPAPILAEWATELYDKFGVRIDHGAATHELVRVNSAMGNNGPVREVKKGSASGSGASPNPEMKQMQSAHAALMEWLQEKDPTMAARVRDAQGDPVKSAILLQDIRRDSPEVWEKGQEILANTPAEALEP